MIYLKLIAYTLFTFCLFYFNNRALFFAVLVLAFLLYIFYPDRRIRKGIVPIGIFTFSVFISNLLLFTPGRILWESSIITITDRGLDIAFVRAVRVIGLVYGAKLLVISSGADEIIKALKRMLGPLKKFGLSTDSFFDTMALTLKMLPEIKKEALRRVDAQKRNSTATPVYRLRVWIDVMVPLLLDTIRMPEVFLKDTAGHKTD